MKRLWQMRQEGWVLSMRWRGASEIADVGAQFSGAQRDGESRNAPRRASTLATSCVCVQWHYRQLRLLARTRQKCRSATRHRDCEKQKPRLLRGFCLGAA